MAQRIHAIKPASPLTTDAGILAPHAVLVQPLVTQLRVTLEAIETFENAIAQCAQHPPDFPLFQALPGAGPVFAPRLLAACWRTTGTLCVRRRTAQICRDRAGDRTQRQAVLGALAPPVSQVPPAHMR